MVSLNKRKKELLRKLRSEQVDPETINKISESFESKEFQVAYSKIKPLMFGGLIGKRSETTRKIVRNIIRGYEYCIELEAVLDKNTLTPRQKSLLELLLYMMACEGIFSQAVQLICYLLTGNHHDLYDHMRMKFIKRYEDLSKMSLFVKMQFIEEHGFKFLTDVYDRNLRNCIAHNKYLVEEDGTVFNEETGTKIENLRMKLRELVGMINRLPNVFTVVTAELMVALKKVPHKT